MAQTAQSDPIQEFIALPRDQQMSTLEQLSPDKQDKLLAKVKEYRAKSAPKTVTGVSDTAPDWRDKYTETQYADPNAPALSGKEAVKAVGNIGAGLMTPFLRPVDTLKGLMRMDPPVAIEESKEGKKNAYQEMWEQLKEHPLETIETGIGNAAAFGAAGEVAPKVIGPVTKTLQDTVKSGGKRVVETVTGTGPKTTGKLVEATKAGNEAADAYSSLRARIETARKNALETGNKKYASVNPALNPIQADPEFMQGAMADALENLKGSKSEPTLLKDMERKLERGDAFTYEDLQGDYSRLGKELSKGTLPGDEYHAYDELHEAIGQEMQNIAKRADDAEVESGGENPNYEGKLKEARDYWRLMKQTFGKPLTDTDAATGVLRSTAPDLAEQSTMGNRIRLLGAFDPAIPGEFARLEKAQTASKGAPKPLPGETGKVGTEQVQEAKAGSVHRTADFLRRRALTIGTFVTGYKALSAVGRAMMGDAGALAGLPADVAEGVAVMGGMHGLANLLESPRVLKLLTEPTPRDLAQIPLELRGELKPIVQAAQKQGIAVDPKLAALVGVVVGPKTRAIQKTADDFRNAAQ